MKKALLWFSLLATALVLNACSENALPSEDSSGSYDSYNTYDTQEPVKVVTSENVYDLGATGDGKTDDSAAFSSEGEEWLLVPLQNRQKHRRHSFSCF